MDQLQITLLHLSHLNLTGRIVDKERNPFSSGGSSDVYSAWSKKHNEKVAVKVLRMFIQKSESFAAKRLEREIKIWATLRHDYVLPLLGYFTEDGSVIPSLVSEWSEHGTLHVFMKTFDCACIETHKLAFMIAEGLQYLHSKGIIHADLNSHNILISKLKTPMICDFGLSVQKSQLHTATDESESMLSSGGTIRWMAKELLIFSPDIPAPKHDEMSDIWAFGMVVYELLSWRVPYYALKEHFVAFAIIKGELPEKPAVSYIPQIFNDL